MVTAYRSFANETVIMGDAMMTAARRESSLLVKWRPHGQTGELTDGDVMARCRLVRAFKS